MSDQTILAIDTAMNGCGVGVCAGGRSFFEYKSMIKGQAESLMPLIEDILGQADQAYGDIDAIITTIGPGAFTGLRVGISTARSMALALGVPIYGITTMEALALKYREEQDVESSFAVLIETKRTDFYVQIFDAQGGALAEPFAAEAGEVLSRLSEDVVLIGDALARFQKEAGSGFSGACLGGYEQADMGQIAKVFAEHGAQGNMFQDATPLYIRPPDVSLSKKKQRKLA